MTFFDLLFLKLLDVLCVAPNFISRDDFFGSFVECLSQREEASLVLPVPEAYTPVVKFTLNDQPVDMIFVSLAFPSLPRALNLLESDCMRGLDEKGVRCINGVRVAERILDLVPNRAVFVQSLRMVKHWARQRGLYSNVLGFLGGVNFAILVAFICQRFVHACASTVVKKFFTIYCQWCWPNPVLLTPIVSEITRDGKMWPVWNPRINASDAMHIMPIITPVYPAMNSTYNMGPPQFRVWQVQ